MPEWRVYACLGFGPIASIGLLLWYLRNHDDENNPIHVVVALTLGSIAFIFVGMLLVAFADWLVHVQETRP